MNNLGTMGLIVLLNQVLNVGATTGFALSGNSQTTQRFFLWQIVGSIFGLGTQVSYAGLVRFSSLEFANAIGIGLAFVSAQIFSAYVYFHVPFTGWQWFGTALVFIGIVCIALGK
jgi:drug/metabolite transporter (DMT)-like permease